MLRALYPGRCSRVGQRCWSCLHAEARRAFEHLRCEKKPCTACRPGAALQFAPEAFRADHELAACRKHPQTAICSAEPDVCRIPRSKLPSPRMAALCNSPPRSFAEIVAWIGQARMRFKSGSVQISSAVTNLLRLAGVMPCVCVCLC